MIFFFQFLLVFHKAKIILSTYDEVTQVVAEKPCFVLVISSDSFNYYSILSEFRTAARKSQSLLDFYILQVSTLSKKQIQLLNCTTFPALIPYYIGKPSTKFYGPFSYGTIFQFINYHSTSRITFIQNQEDLDKFFLTSAAGILITVDSESGTEQPNEKEHPVLTEFYYNHFNELSLSFVEKKLLLPIIEKNNLTINNNDSRFYLFRFFDEAFLQLPDLTNTTEDFLVKTLYVYANPNIYLFEARLANYFENSNQDFGLIMLNMSNNIYATHKQAEFLRIAKSDCGINISYLPLTLNEIPNIRYGFPVEKQEMFYIIDSRENPQKKYKYYGEFSSPEDIHQFCNSYKKGQLKQFYKSGTIPKSERYTDIDDYDSTNVLDFTESSEFSALGVYYTSDDSLTNYSMAVKAIQKESSFNNKIKFGQFSIAYNDWPGTNTSFLPMPRLLIFEKGKLIMNERAEYVDQIIEYITNAINHVDNKEL
ncbi:hypothetical protein M9Y10_001144 [Tritrichomonas musculus]|uniref:Thioredoxin domain-containing protein n=1 Tax=Tritrichomonas musculus TaxID=1915356 RepID=A0ABR2L686_9EUKA